VIELYLQFTPTTKISFMMV